VGDKFIGIPVYSVRARPDTVLYIWRTNTGEEQVGTYRDMILFWGFKVYIWELHGISYGFYGDMIGTLMGFHSYPTRVLRYDFSPCIKGHSYHQTYKARCVVIQTSVSMYTDILTYIFITRCRGSKSRNHVKNHRRKIPQNNYEETTRFPPH
jgi:hypothetical protein